MQLPGNRVTRHLEVGPGRRRWAATSSALHGGVAVARAAHGLHAAHCELRHAAHALEQTVAASESPKIFQLCIRGDWEWVTGMIDRIKAAGHQGFCLTVDSSYTKDRVPGSPPGGFLSEAVW